ncbi:MAG TPA: histidine--tRNA ligase [Pyrinomonadaceae bacterium]
MASAKTQPARGMRDFLPEDVRKREFVIGVIKEVYQRYGFEPLETPAVENIETLMGKYGEEGNQLIFKILKRGVHEGTGEADLALRYDLTVPLARVVAEYREKLPKFFKRYQIQPVWRADRPARGRFREFYQCDVDVVGTESVIAEVELCSAVSEVLETLGFHDFTIRINHRKVLGGMLKYVGVSQNEQSSFLTILDKLDKIGADAVELELAKKGFQGDLVGELLQYLVFAQDNAQRSQHAIGELHKIANFMNDGSPDRAQGQWQLAQIESLASHTPAHKYLRFDPSLARGLSYYTGTMFEISVRDLSGSLGGGGRYDNLVGMFGGREIPACGFSLGLERILVVMNERGMFSTDTIKGPADIMVALWSENDRGNSLALAMQLRARGIRVDLYPEPDKLGKQFGFASSRQIPLVAVLGTEELLRDEVKLKDLRSGEQRSVKSKFVSDEVLQLIKGDK